MFNLKFACISSLIVQLLVYNVCVLSLHNCLENSVETRISQKHALVRGEKGHGGDGCRMLSLH